MNQINTITRNLNCPVRAISYVESAQLYRVRLKPLRRRLALGRLGQLTEPRHLRTRIEAIGLGLGVDRVSVAVEDGILWLEIPKSKSDIVHVSDLPKPDGGLPLALGLDTTNRLVSLDLDDPGTPHVLVAGTTGSGKTVLLKSMIHSLVSNVSPDVLGLVVLDGKYSLECVRHLPHVRRYTNDLAESYDILKQVLHVTRQVYAGHYADAHKRAIVVVIDEFGDLILRDRSVETLVVQLAQIGRVARTHLVVATQRPSREVVTGLVKNNFPARVALAMPSVYDSRTILDRPGAERLLGRGDGLLLKGGRLTRFQAAYVEDDEFKLPLG